MKRHPAILDFDEDRTAIIDPNEVVAKNLLRGQKHGRRMEFIGKPKEKLDSEKMKDVGALKWKLLRYSQSQNLEMLSLHRFFFQEMTSVRIIGIKGDGEA